MARNARSSSAARMEQRRRWNFARPCGPRKSMDYRHPEVVRPPTGAFADRRAAGVELAAQLRHYTGRDDVVVLALPRGGVPVGFEIARTLGASLDVFVVRKLGVPGHAELAMGAIA